MFAFGSGVLLGYRNDVANQTPINFGLLQDVSIDFDGTIKELFGQYQYPVAVARGTTKIGIKASVARISGLMFSSLYFGVSIATGQTLTAYGEAGTIPAPSGPYTITVANSANFVDDYGVVFALTGLPLKKVASSPATGQYSVSAGVYTFAAADASLGVLISYTYAVSGSGQKFTMSNPLLGTTPSFACSFYTTFQSKPFNIVFNNCVAGKLGIATKLEDFTIPNLEASAYADAAGNVFTMSMGEAS